MKDKFTNHRSWAALANKNRTSEGDLDLKDNLARVLRQNFDIYTIFHEVFIAVHKRKKFWVRNLTEQEFYSNEWFAHHPDMISTNQTTPIVFEIDGPFHFMNAKGVKKTNERNKHYEMGNIRLVWITDKDAGNYDDVLVEILASRLARWGIFPNKK